MYVAKDNKRLKIFDERTKPNNTDFDDGTRSINLKNESVYSSIKNILNDWERNVEVIAKKFGVEPWKIK